MNYCSSNRTILHFINLNNGDCFRPMQATIVPKYRVSIRSFSDYKLLLQENYVEYKYVKLFLPLFKLVFFVSFVTFGFWMQHFQTGGLGEMVRYPGHHDLQISIPLISFYVGMLSTKCFRHQFQILQT